MRRFTWILLSQNAQVIGLDGGILTVGFKTPGAKDSFVGGGSEEILRQAAIDVIGADWRVESIVDPSADPGAGIAPVVTRPATDSVPEPQYPDAAAGSSPDRPPAWIAEESDAPPVPIRDQPAPPAPETIASVRSNIAPTRTGDQPAKPVDTRDDDVRADDQDLDDGGLGGADLIVRELGATVIDEITHD